MGSLILYGKYYIKHYYSVLYFDSLNKTKFVFKTK